MISPLGICNNLNLHLRLVTISIIICSVFVGCQSPVEQDILAQALRSTNPKIKKVIANPEAYEIQIRYTEIHRDKDSIWFEDFDYQVNDSVYFYPASTVKFPAAVAALEKINEVDTLWINSPFFIEGDTLTTSFEKDIEAIFAVSDNKANNDLIEFLGFDELNQRMRQRGVVPIRISHRLSTNDAHNPKTKSLIFQTSDSTIVPSLPKISAVAEPLKLKGIKKGKGYFEGENKILEPFDLSFKNYFPIGAQSALIKRIIFPEAFHKSDRFNLSKQQRAFLLKAMSSLPYQLGYDRLAYYDSYVKFFVFGDLETEIPTYIKIYNKVGYAYGTLTDTAYIRDESTGADFILHATILVNENQIFNDDNYQFEEVGIPFLAELGREILHLKKMNVRNFPKKTENRPALGF